MHSSSADEERATPTGIETPVHRANGASEARRHVALWYIDNLPSSCVLATVQQVSSNPAACKNAHGRETRRSALRLPRARHSLSASASCTAYGASGIAHRPLVGCTSGTITAHARASTDGVDGDVGNTRQRGRQPVREDTRAEPSKIAVQEV